MFLSFYTIISEFIEHSILCKSAISGRCVVLSSASRNIGIAVFFLDPVSYRWCCCGFGSPGEWLAVSNFVITSLFYIDCGITGFFNDCWPIGFDYRGPLDNKFCTYRGRR